MSFLDNHSDKTKGLQVKLQTCGVFWVSIKKVYRYSRDKMVIHNILFYCGFKLRFWHF